MSIDEPKTAAEHVRADEEARAPSADPNSDLWDELGHWQARSQWGNSSLPSPMWITLRFAGHGICALREIARELRQIRKCMEDRT